MGKIKGKTKNLINDENQIFITNRIHWFYISYIVAIIKKKRKSLKAHSSTNLLFFNFYNWIDSRVRHDL